MRFLDRNSVSGNSFLLELVDWLTSVQQSDHPRIILFYFIFTEHSVSGLAII